MARQNIQFKGMRHSPSEITGQDGDLLECVNLIHENGEIKPLEMPERTAHRGFYGNDTLVAVHNLTDGKKFVYAVYNQVNTYIHIKNENEEDNDVLINGVVGRGIPHEEIKWAETIGNTLIIGTDKSIHYALYKNGQYKWLGDKLPQPVFEFDMELNSNEEDGYIEVNEPNPPCEFFNYSTDEYEPLAGGGAPFEIVHAGTSTWIRFNPEHKANKIAIRDNILSKVAELTNTAKTKGKFIYPFFVRYAVRMFDGNYAMHSEPILMLPSTDICPIAAKVCNILHENGDYLGYYGNISVQTKAKSLKYKFIKFVDVNGADVDAGDWEDIIKGVDLFLSSEIVSFDERYYDQSDNVIKYYYWHEGHTITGGTYDYDNPKFPKYGNAYVDNTKETWLQNHISNSTINETPDANGYLDCMIPLASFSKNNMSDRIKETSIFYRVKRYDLSLLNSDDWQSYRFFHNEVDRGILERLETLPTLPDDYVSRSRMVGSVNYNYNQRLVLGNISLQAPKWYQDAKLFQKVDIYDLYICFVIEKPERTIYIRYDKPVVDEWGLGVYDFGHYLFYPDPDCKKAIVRLKLSQPGSLVEVFREFEIPMYEHTGLHGSYALMPDLESLHEAVSDGAFEQCDELPQESDDRYYQMPNTIAMSSVANPFHFPATNFKDIGRTKVVGIAANVLDVSSGQWGQYPLYVFCSDGIIAVMIDGEGKMGGIQAVSADVLREPHGLSQPTLIQTNQMLVFITQRGVMAIAGTRINCISEAMNGRHFNAMRELDGVDYHVGAFENLITRASEGTAFSDFSANGFLGYDYAHNRVLLLRHDREYQYVLSLNTMLWSKEIIYNNLNEFQLNVIPSNTASGETPNQRSLQFLDVTPIHAAVNNYTELYLQDTDGWLYKTMDVQGEDSVKQLHRYGYLVSRPIRFGTDEYKTLVRVLHRYTHYASMSFVKMALYGSRDGVKYGRINTLRGMSYQYFIFVVYTYLKPNERYSYMTVDFETRLTNKLR